MDDHPIDYDDPAIWDAHMAVFEDALTDVARGPVDAVFSGEDYGDELARRLGATHVRVPRDISATQVRADLPGSWSLLAPPARPGLATRIVVLGPESTGTTTIAYRLAERLEAAFVPEYGRAYTSRKLADARQLAHESGSAKPGLDELEWLSDEFTVIAARQTAAIADAADRASVVVADTDALATSVWHERYRGGPHPPALALARSLPADLYLLTTTDEVPFMQDGLRDGESIRAGMTALFTRALRASGSPWVVLDGSEPERLAVAADACRALVHRRRFAAS
jgi:NadR type nicotinamide-nucleotide adenylyltransferase